MKYLLGVYAFAIAFFMSCRPLGQVLRATEQECKNPPVKTVGPASIAPKEGYIAQCLKNEDYLCCAYSFMLSDEATLCFHILCQPADDCSADWLYYATECPPVEESKYEEKPQSTADDQEGWWTEV